MGKKITFDDLISTLKEKEEYIGEDDVLEGDDMLRFIKEVKELVAMLKGGGDGGNTQQTKTVTQQTHAQQTQHVDINGEYIYHAILNASKNILNMYGDIPLSKLIEFMGKYKQDIIMMLDKELEDYKKKVNSNGS